MKQYECLWVYKQYECGEHTSGYQWREGREEGQDKLRVGGSDGKASACNAGSIPGLERSPGEGNGKPLQYSCLENPMDGVAW